MVDGHLHWQGLQQQQRRKVRHHAQRLQVRLQLRQLLHGDRNLPVLERLEVLVVHLTGPLHHLQDLLHGDLLRPVPHLLQRQQDACHTVPAKAMRMRVYNY